MSDDRPGHYSSRPIEPIPVRTGFASSRTIVTTTLSRDQILDPTIVHRDADTVARQELALARAEIEWLTAERDEARRDLATFFDAMIEPYGEGIFYIDFNSEMMSLGNEGFSSREAAIERIRERFGLTPKGDV